MAKVAWDAALEYDDILDDFCRNYYGPAGEYLRRYYRTLERAVTESDDCFRGGNIANVAKIMSVDLLRELKGDLAQAEAVARGRQDILSRVKEEMARYRRSTMTVLGRTDVDRNGGPNRVANAGFEAGRRDWSAAVQRGKYRHAIDETESREGKRSARVVCDEAGRAMWRQVVPVEKGQRYHFSAWVKAEGKSPGVLILWLHQGPTHRTGKLAYLDANVGGRWQQYIVPELIAIDDRLTVFLMSDGPGTIWFDDLRLVKVQQMRN